MRAPLLLLAPILYFHRKNVYPAPVSEGCVCVDGEQTEVEPALSPPAEIAEPKDHRKPSKVAWATLGLLVVGALAIPFTHDRVLVQDDFTTPEVLRVWPEDGATLAYVDGEYRVSVLSAKSTPFAVHELPHAVTGMTIAVDTRTVTGSPGVVLQCISELNDVAAPDGTTTSHVTSSYVFLLDPSNGGRYAIGKSGDNTPLASGDLATDSGGRLTVGCVAADGGTKLTMQEGNAQPVEVTDPQGLGSFVAIGLGAYGNSSGATVAYDNIRVVEAT